MMNEMTNTTIWHMGEHVLQMDETQAHLLEQHAERAALARVWGVNFTHALTGQGISPEISFPVTARTRRARETAGSLIRMVTLRGSDLYDERVWHKFLASRQQRAELTNLVTYADQLSREYLTWLLHKHTGRSRLVADREQLLWLEQVASMVVLRRMLEAKYHLYRTSGQGFADPWVAHVMEYFLFAALLTQETAKAVYRACREREQAQEYLEPVTAMLSGFLESRKAVLRSDLPALPHNTNMPQILLSASLGEQHSKEENQ